MPGPFPIRVMVRAMREVLATILALSLASLLTGCSGDTADRQAPARFVVSAAISLQPVLEPLIREYERSRPEVVISLNMGGSGTLKRQIEQGAPADLFIAAGAEWMDELERQGFIDPSTRTDLARNELVLIVPKGASPEIRGFRDLPRVRLAAIGEPDTVPAGAYAVYTLRSLGIWDRLSPRQFTYARDVRQVLMHVAAGGVDAGIVYRTDALSSPAVEVKETAPAGAHPPIRYPAAVVAASAHPDEAKRFLTYLVSPEAQRMFASHGFIPAGEAGDLP